MSKTLAQLLVALAITVAVWLLGGQEWPQLVIGSVLALSLWMMLFAGSWGGGRRVPGSVSTRNYALAAAIGVVLGNAFFRIGDDNGSFWAVGFIMAGALVSSAAPSSQRSSDEQ